MKCEYCKKDITQENPKYYAWGSFDDNGEPDTQLCYKCYQQDLAYYKDDYTDDYDDDF